jgi:[ribosomal protein S5]-alanine N-acetyltransferase
MTEALDLSPPPPIASPRLILRLVTPQDLPDLMRVNGDDEVTRYLPYATWQSMSDAEAWLARMTGMHEARSAMQFVVVDKAGGNAIGACLLFQFEPKSARAEIGFVLGRAHWRTGLMREAMVALIGHAMGAMRVRRLEAQVDPRNLASQGLLRRLGFTREGLLRQRWIDKGAPCDVEMYGLLRDEWKLAPGQE